MKKTVFFAAVVLGTTMASPGSQAITIMGHLQNLKDGVHKSFVAAKGATKGVAKILSGTALAKVGKAKVNEILGKIATEHGLSGFQTAYNASGSILPTACSALKSQTTTDVIKEDFPDMTEDLADAQKVCRFAKYYKENDPATAKYKTDAEAVAERFAKKTTTKASDSIGLKDTREPQSEESKETPPPEVNLTTVIPEKKEGTSSVPADAKGDPKTPSSDDPKSGASTPMASHAV